MKTHLLQLKNTQSKYNVSLHDIRTVCCGDKDVQVKDDVQVVGEVWSSMYGLQISAEKTN